MSEPTHTNYTAAALASLLGDAYPAQGQLARDTEMSETAVSRHLSGRRAVTASALRAYLRAIPQPHRRRVLRAWLRDQIDPEIDDIIDGPGAPNIHEPATPYLPATSRSAIEWLAREVDDDPELDRAVQAFCRRMGWPGQPQ